MFIRTVINHCNTLLSHKVFQDIWTADRLGNNIKDPTFQQKYEGFSEVHYLSPAATVSQDTAKKGSTVHF